MRTANQIKINNNVLCLFDRGTISELQLMKVTDADVGTYECKAVNDRGTDAQNASVQVIKGKERELLVINVA